MGVDWWVLGCAPASLHPTFSLRPTEWVLIGGCWVTLLRRSTQPTLFYSMITMKTQIWLA